MVVAIINARGEVSEVRNIGNHIPDVYTNARPVIDAAIPNHNVATHRPVPTYTVEQSQVLRSWTIVPLTADDLEEADAAMQLAQIQAMLDDLRNGVGTTAQRLQRVERTCAQLVKRLAKKGVLP